MKKLSIGLILCLASTTSLAKVVVDTEFCAGTEYFYDINNNFVKYNPTIHTNIDSSTIITYIGEAVVPHLRVTNTGSRGNLIYITNTQSSSVKFYFEPTYFSETSGNPISLSPETFHAIFSTTNNPKAANGATMPGGSYGQIEIKSNSSAFGIAKLKWSSDTCFETAPMVASIESFFNAGDRFGSSIHAVNNGNPF